MKISNCLVSVAVVLLAVSPTALGKSKKNPPQRGMLERMDAVPCGAKQKGISGVGSVFASAGLTHMNSDEKLCPEYLLRTDEMEYHIRPVDTKHAVILPIGHEGQFKIKKDLLYMSIPDEDHKARTYHVVAMKPLNTGTDTVNSAHREPDKRLDSTPVGRPVQSPKPTTPANGVNVTAQDPGPGPGR